MKFTKLSVLAIFIVFLIPVSTAVVSHEAAQIYIDIGGGSQTLQQMFDSGALGQWDNGAGGAIYYNDGNVGIGTATPETKLQVSGGHLMLDNSNALRSKTTLGAVVDLAYISNTDQYRYANSAIAVSGGNVGIGTTSPAYKLDISGDVRWTGTLQGGSVPWARLSGFPSACPAGQYVRAVGTTLTCSTPPTGGHGDGSNCNAGYAPLGVDANGNAQGCWDVAAESHNHDSAYVNVGGDTMTGSLNLNGEVRAGGGGDVGNYALQANGNIYASQGIYAGDDLVFYGDIVPDGNYCGNGKILKKSGADWWSCADDSVGSLSCTTAEATGSLGSYSDVTAYCPSGYVITGGAFDCDGPDEGNVYYTEFNGNGYRAICHENVGGAGQVQVRAFARCCKII